MSTVTQKSFVRGVVATSGVMSQPKGSLPRASNLLLTRRGSLRTCDGSQLLHEFSGAVQSGRGKITASFLFNPIGVASYYLVIAKALDQRLINPNSLAVATAGGGTLPAATYFYVITALDGVGGETAPSNEVSVVTGANGKNTLTWNVIPNAVSYNVYRSTSTGTETLLTGANLPVSQPAFGTITASFVDDGSVSNPSLALASSYYTSPIAPATGQYWRFQTETPHGFVAGSRFAISGVTPSSPFNGSFTVTAVIDPFTIAVQVFTGFGTGQTLNGSGGTLTAGAPPGVFGNNTQQTALYKMPLILGSPAVLPVSYDNTNIVALFPADLPIYNGGGGGSGGHGGTGGGGNTGGNTPSGGVAGNLSQLPQMLEFTNQVVMALGNGFPPQVYSDPTQTTDHSAKISTITSATVDAFGVVTVVVSGGHGIPTSGLGYGANVIITGTSPSGYNGTYPVLQVVNGTTFKVNNINAIGLGASTVGTVTTTTIPIYSNFTVAFPVWTASFPYTQGSIVQPTVSNGHYYKAIQGGTSAASQPTFPTGTGQRVVDGGIIWQESGETNTAAPPPPGAAHMAVYSGALFVFNTCNINTSNGLDGPCCLRMSDINNLNSWNPINQAFLDKDDATEGMGLSAFTITAQGIAPQGSLVALKNYSTYQILGLFGSPSFAIQRVKTDMGCIAPRTIQYVPGFGIERMTHLGVAVFDGVDDRVVSEEIRPYLFASNDTDVADITVMDSNFAANSWGAQTANPPMYVVAIPIGDSGGQLTRIICHDLVLKGWTIVDLPYPISTMSQFRTLTTNPVTVLGGFSDGTLARWQAGDAQWDVGATGARTPSNVQWSLETPTVASNDLDQKIYLRRLMIRGINTNTSAGLNVGVELDGVPLPNYASPMLPSGDFETEVGIGVTVLRAEATIAGSGDIELWGWSWTLTPKPAGVPLRVT